MVLVRGCTTPKPGLEGANLLRTERRARRHRGPAASGQVAVDPGFRGISRPRRRRRNVRKTRQRIGAKGPEDRVRARRVHHGRLAPTMADGGGAAPAAVLLEARIEVVREGDLAGRRRPAVRRRRVLRREDVRGKPRLARARDDDAALARQRRAAEAGRIAVILIGIRRRAGPPPGQEPRRQG